MILLVCDSTHCFGWLRFFYRTYPSPKLCVGLRLPSGTQVGCTGVEGTSSPSCSASEEGSRRPSPADTCPTLGTGLSFWNFLVQRQERVFWCWWSLLGYPKFLKSYHFSDFLMQCVENFVIVFGNPKKITLSVYLVNHRLNNRYFVPTVEITSWTLTNASQANQSHPLPRVLFLFYFFSAPCGVLYL